MGPTRITAASTIIYRACPTIWSHCYRVGLMGKRHEAPVENFPSNFSAASMATGEAIDLDMTLLDTFIRETGDQPWCMVVGSNQAHTP